MRTSYVICAIALILSGCASSALSNSPQRSQDPKAVMGKTWEWQETVTPVEKITVPHPEHYTFRLNESGKADFRFDCNRGGGTFLISEGKLSFGPMMSTRMACSEDSLDAIYIRYLRDVTSFFIEGDRLYLELPFDSGTLRFREQKDGR